MGSEGIGECSRRADGENSGDESPEDAERPLKKARYVWQVKGKYHLRESLNNANKDESAETSETHPIAPTEKTGTEELALKKSNCSDNCNGRCCIEALLAHADDIITMTGEEFSDEENPTKNIDKSISDEIPVTLVKPTPKNQDYYLKKWQARQVAKGYMDNTINTVLETCMVAPFDASDLIENCEEDGQVEDEGILMAIQSHGLQTGMENWGESSTNHNVESSAVSFLRTQQIAESAMDNYQNVHNELLKKKLSEESNEHDANESFESMEMGDHTNFLDAAVSVAIQKKGLSSQNYV